MLVFAQSKWWWELLVVFRTPFLRYTVTDTLKDKTADRDNSLLTIRHQRHFRFWPELRHHTQVQRDNEDDNGLQSTRNLLQLHSVSESLNKWKIFTYHTRLLGKTKVLIEKLYHNNQIFNVYVYFEHTSVSFSHSKSVSAPKKKMRPDEQSKRRVKLERDIVSRLEWKKEEYNRINTNILTTVDSSFAHSFFFLLRSQILNWKIIRFNIIVLSELN